MRPRHHARTTASAAILLTVLAASLPVGIVQAQTASPAATGAGKAVPAERATMEAQVRAFYDPFNGASVDVFDDVLTEDWTEEPAPDDLEPGREPYKANVAGLREMAPDLTISVNEIVIEGDLAVARSTLSATHAGPMFGVPATGIRFEIMTMDMHRFEGDRIAETWHVEDWLSALGQIGAMGGEGAGSEGASNDAALASGSSSTTVALFERIFASADRNGDGQLTRSETDHFQSGIYLGMDADGDARISEAEFVQYDFGESGLAFERAREAEVRDVLMAYFAEIDRNGDGVVATGEQSVSFQTDFGAADTMRDGRLTRDEFVSGLPILQRLAAALMDE